MKQQEKKKAAQDKKQKADKKERAAQEKAAQEKADQEEKERAAQKKAAQEKADQEKEKAAQEEKAEAEAQDRAAQGHLDPWSKQEANAYLKELKKKPLAEALKVGFRRDAWNKSLDKMMQTFEAYGLRSLIRQRVERILQCEPGLHTAIWNISRVQGLYDQPIPDWAGNVVSWAGGLLLSILPMMGMIA